MSWRAHVNRPTIRICCAILIVGLVAPASATAAIAQVPLGTPGIDSFWAYVEESTPVYRAPSRGSGSITRLSLKTSDGTDELVSLISEFEDRHGESWIRIRLSIRPNNSTGWVPRDTLGGLRHVDKHLHVDRRKLTATLTKYGEPIFTARIGVGKSYWPTPTGNFYVRTRLVSPGAMYGPLAFGTSAKSPVLTDWPGGGVIGLHGTDQPYLLPGRVSHGCVRFRNSEIRRLGSLMSVGTPITIR